MHVNADFIVFLVMIIALTIFLVVMSIYSTRHIPSRNTRSPIVEQDHLWHEPKGEYGENHADIVDDRVVSHPQPEIGYVVLNGIKRKLEDCKWL